MFGIARRGAMTLAAICIALMSQGALAQDIKGAGSTFVAPVIGKWAEHYEKKMGHKVDYASVGSGMGISRIEAGEVDFGASDKPLDPRELAAHRLCQFPVVVGGIVPVINLPNVAPGKMRLSGPVLAAIFMGDIKYWDDERIRSGNGSLTLPHLAIGVVHRSDGSGTTYNWTDYLAKASPEWRAHAGVGLTVSWPVGSGGNGNGGVAEAVEKSSGSIGYVEYTYALQKKLSYTLVANTYNIWVAPSVEGFQAAAASIDWNRYPDFDALMTNGGGPAAYPITASTYVLIPCTPGHREPARPVLAFFDWALSNGDQDAADLHYAALPPNLVALIHNYWKAHWGY